MPMNYIIKHANGDWTPVQFPLSLEDLFALIKKNEDRFVIFNDADDMLFLGTDYLSSCKIMPAKDPEPAEMSPTTISDYF